MTFSFDKHKLANFGVLLVVIMSLLIFAASFLPGSRLHTLVYYREINNFVQRTASVALLIIVWHLYMRKRFAWMFTIVILTAKIAINMVLHHHILGLIAVGVELIALITLLISYRSFMRPSDRISVHKALCIVGFTMIFIFLSAVLGRYNLRIHEGANISIGESFFETISIIMGANANFPHYDAFILYVFWVCVIASVSLILHSAFINKKRTDQEKQSARELVLKYGQNSSSYLVLEDDKTLFFGTGVPGVIAYGAVGNAVVVCGDPICADDDFLQLLIEFKTFCVNCTYQAIFMGTTHKFLRDYEQLGYHHVKSGEEAMFELATYSIAGGKMQKLRSLITHANKEVTTHEYKPQTNYDAEIEKSIEAVSKAWLESKKSSQLCFTVGGVGLDDPMDRRYFYAADADGNIVAFNVFLPFDHFQGYLADVTRRIPHAPGGVTEKLIYDGFMTFRDEGVKWGSMGLAPLANIQEEGQKNDMTVKLLAFIYEKCNGFYGFKDLHHAKEKYNPSQWIPGYFIFSTKNITPEIAYAMIKIQNPSGIKDFLFSNIKSRIKSIRTQESQHNKPPDREQSL